MRKALIVFIISFVVIGGVALFFLTRPKTSNVYIVGRENLTNSLEVSGTYEVAAQTLVSAPSGVITKLYVGNGDSVAKGTWLMYVASTATPTQVAAAYATYKAAASAYQEALNTRRATQAAVDNIHDQVKNHGTDETYANRDARTTAEVTNDNAYDALLAAEAALKSSEIAYNNTQSASVAAPTSGTIVNLQNKVGDLVSGTVAMIADFSNPHVTVQVNEVNILRIKEGQKANISFDALPGANFEGTITGIDTIGTLSQGQITYRVTLTLSGNPNGIKPNMTANAKIETVNKENVITVPSEVILKKDDKYFVRLQDGSSVEVTIGDEGLTKTEIVSGLNVGDKIIIP